ncbi:transporter substrate-binding domain-containing protein [Dasania marina]|uniref:substrate-binding periplasmic protein n=1 Tax=Dasania marina TaxID=471499 RepID=UPI0030D9F429
MLNNIKIIVLLLPLMMAALSVRAGSATIIEMTSNNWFPYAYSDNGKHKGSAYEIAKAVMERSGLDYSYSTRPFARVYSEGLSKKNYLMICIGRTPYRENLFKWVGPTTKHNAIKFYAHENSLINAAALSNGGSFSVAVINYAYSDEYLTSLEHNYKIIRVGTTEQLVKLVLNGRVDLVIMQENILKATLHKLDYPLSSFKEIKPIFLISEYMAFSLQTPDAVVDKVRQSYDKLQREGKIALQ